MVALSKLSIWSV